jgi:hypothetical protein
MKIYQKCRDLLETDIASSIERYSHLRYFHFSKIYILFVIALFADSIWTEKFWTEKYSMGGMPKSFDPRCHIFILMVSLFFEEMFSRVLLMKYKLLRETTLDSEHTF